MSVRITSWVWEQSQAQGTTFTVLLGLADIADDRGICWPAIDTLAKKCRISSDTARRAIRKLVELGELVVQEVPGRSHRYTIAADRDGVQAPSPSQVATPTRPVSAVPDPLQVATPTHRQDATPSNLQPLAQLCHPTPSTAMPGAPSTAVLPEPSLTIKEPSEGAPARTATIRGHRLPDTFTVTDDMRRWARGQWPWFDVDAETEIFRDFWRAETGARASKRDWRAAWQVWIRRAVSRVPAWRRTQLEAESRPAAAASRSAYQPYDGDPDDLVAYRAWSAAEARRQAGA